MGQSPTGPWRACKPLLVGLGLLCTCFVLFGIFGILRVLGVFGVLGLLGGFAAFGSHGGVDVRDFAAVDRGDCVEGFSIYFYDS